MESTGNKQLQKLLAKEEQRLEQEQKRAALERRRKQQQDRFQLQHELNHPLRQSHTQQRSKIFKGRPLPLSMCIVFLNPLSFCLAFLLVGFRSNSSFFTFLIFIAGLAHMIQIESETAEWKVVVLILGTGPILRVLK